MGYARSLRSRRIEVLHRIVSARISPSSFVFSDQTQRATFMIVCTVINRMTLDLRAFSTTGGWFTATRVGSDAAADSGMPMLKGRYSSANSNTLAELTLSNNYDKKWKDEESTFYSDNDTHVVSTYGGHPQDFDAIEMGRVDYYYRDAHNGPR